MVSDFDQRMVRHSRKKVVWIVFVLAIGAILLIAFVLTKNQKEYPPEGTALQQKNKNPLLEDRDNDGLQAWEEQIYGTDPNSADSDGDGMKDGEEVIAGRNPLVKGSGDAITDGKGGHTDQTNEKKETAENLTQTLFDEFIKRGGVGALLQKEGSTGASQFIAERVDELITKNALPYTQESKETVGIRTSEDISPRAIKTYLNRVADIFKIDIASFKDDDLDLFLTTLQSGNLEELQGLGAYREAIDAVIGNLKKIAVPKTIVWFHERELALLDETAQQLRVLERAELDPVAALAAIIPRINTKIAIIKLHRGDLRLWLAANKITLSSQDSAYFLIR